MGRRRRKKGPPDSTHWSSYRPNESKYWFHGGPWVPPEQIGPAGGPRPEHIRPHERPETRLRSVSRMLDEARVQLVSEIKMYRGLHEWGADALPWEWMRQRIRDGEYDRDEPNHIHYQLCNCYGNIARLKALIPAYEAVLAAIEPASAPLFHWNRNDA